MLDSGVGHAAASAAPPDIHPRAVIKYIGSKRSLVPRILQVVASIPATRRVADLFTGSIRVAWALKQAGYEVIANDTASYSEVLARAYVEQDARGVDLTALAAKLAHLEALPDTDGYFTETFCRRARYFQPHNGRRIDAIRAGIDRIADTPLEHATLLACLLEAADRIDSTTGVQMAYLKRWSVRSHRPLRLKMPMLLPGRGGALRLDAAAAAARMGPVDVCYVDPPYNQHSYYANYHLWETLVRGDQPEVYGIACKRADCRTTRSRFNSRVHGWSALTDLFARIQARHVLLSFSDEGFHDLADIVALLASRWGEVASLAFDSKRYIGAKIGVFNLRGERVGEESHLRNTEYLFLAGPDAEGILRRAGTGG